MKNFFILILIYLMSALKLRMPMADDCEQMREYITYSKYFHVYY